MSRCETCGRVVSPRERSQGFDQVFYPVTTQQSVVAGDCGAERSQTLVKLLVRTAFRGEPLFRSFRPDFIETMRALERLDPATKLFRSFRPDFIETL